DRATPPRHAQNADLVRKLTTLGHDLGDHLAAPGARPARTLAIACAAVAEGDLQDRRDDHQPQQTGRADNEKMALEHATQPPRQPALSLNRSSPLRKSRSWNEGPLRCRRASWLQRRRQIPIPGPCPAGLSRPATAVRQPACRLQSPSRRTTDVSSE